MLSLLNMSEILKLLKGKVIKISVLTKSNVLGNYGRVFSVRCAQRLQPPIAVAKP